jgi:hypothetical protein
MIIQSSDKALLRIYECGVCRKTFAEQFDHAQAAHLQAATYGAHRHQAGACCHLGEIEIDMPTLMEITLSIENNVGTT